MIHDQYIKVYDLKSGRFMYEYTGFFIDSSGPKQDIGLVRREKSIIGPKTLSFVKPVNLYSKDLTPHFTTELAVLRIHLFVRFCLAKERVRTLVRKQYQRILDPVSGQYYYYNCRTGWTSWRKPFLLGNEQWDPSDARLWNIDDVAFYLRRLGYS
eukprot:11010539-Ditylum_brightwellii.AAC.1